MRATALRVAMVATLGIGAGAAAQAFAAPGASDYCSSYSDFGVSHGGCVSYFESGGRSAAADASWCKQFQQNEPAVFYYFFKNVGDCVSTIHNY
jgi:hypothetical protein